MNDIRYQVFVSSTYKDLIKHREQVIFSLMKAKAIPVGMELFPASNKNAWSIIKRTIQLSDYYVVIIGGKYGSEDNDGKSYTEKEYDLAVELGIPVMAFLHKEPGKLERDKTETDTDKWNKLQAFRIKAEKNHCNYWINESDLVLKVISSYHDMIEDEPRPGWIRGDKAKTIEDVERLAQLEKQVRELEKELSTYRHDQGTILKLHKECEEEINIKIEAKYGNESQSIKTLEYKYKYSDLFQLISSLLFDEEIEFNIVRSIACDIIRKNVTPDAYEYFAPYNKPNTIEYIEKAFSDKIKKFFSIRNLISVNNNQPIPRDGLGKTWKITELGKKYAHYLNQLSTTGISGTFD